MWKNYKRDFLYLTLSLRQEEVNGMSWSIADSVCKAELLYTAKQSVKLTSPGGAHTYISYIGMCRPIGYGVCALLVWKQVYTLPSLAWNRVWLLRELRECRSAWTYLLFQFQISKKVKGKICEFDMDLKFFCLLSNLKNDNIISA